MNARILEFHKPDVLRRLALSDSGFVFDPLSGASFTVNASGLALIRILQEGHGGDIVQTDPWAASLVGVGKSGPKPM